jgi:hypothetical protein
LLSLILIQPFSKYRFSGDCEIHSFEYQNKLQQRRDTNMKQIKSILLGQLAFVLALGFVCAAGLAVPAAAQDRNYVALYRLYNAQSGRHLYTQNCDEKNQLSANGSFQYEGIAGYVSPRQIRNTVPLYRLLLSNGEHFYTADASEYNNLVTNSSNRSEGVVGYIASRQIRRTVPLYRLTTPDRHFYTTDERERSSYLQRPNATSEGITGYVWTNGVSNCSGGTTPPPTSGNFPVIYAEQNFNGPAMAVERDFAGNNDWNGRPHRIRSMRVPQGWYLVVYSRPNYRGESYNVNFDWSPTPDDYWYGKIRSIKVYRGTPPKQPR